MIRARLLALLPLLAALGLLSGCPRPGEQTSPVAPASQGAGELVMRVGYFPNVTHAPAVLGFSQADPTFVQALEGKARLETKVFNAGPSAMEALHAQALDLSFVGPTPAINAFARGGDVVLIANVANGGAVLVARKGSGLRNVRDLAGKRIAVPQLGNTQDAVLRSLLLREGIRLKDQGGDTSVLPVENPNILALFQSGQLDAACVPEPWGARLELEAGAELLLDEKALWREGDYPVTVLVARKAFLQQHPDLVRAFVAALQEKMDTLGWDEPAEATALNAELKVLTGKELKSEVLTRALGRMKFTTVINMEALQAMAQIMKDVGYAKQVPDLAGFVDPSFLPAAVGEAGLTP